MLFNPNRLEISWSDWRGIPIELILFGLIALFAMFISGAFRTWETARGDVLIYPYIMLTLENTSIASLDILILAGIQTVEMQFSGSYFR